jgi:polyisoprenoid-binding protein YceI
MARLRREHLIVLVLAALAVAAVAALFVYKDRGGGTPAPTPTPAVAVTAQPSASPSAASAPTPVNGTWHVGPASTIGYRAVVTAFGLHTTVAAHSPRVWGSVVVAKGSVTRCSLFLDMTSYSGTSRQRDAIDAPAYPTARFVLVRPFVLTSGSSGAGQAAASGKLEFRGFTTPLVMTVSYARGGGAFVVRAHVPIAFARWHVTLPAGFTCRGTVEIVLHLVRGAGNTATVTS